MSRSASRPPRVNIRNRRSGEAEADDETSDFHRSTSRLVLVDESQLIALIESAVRRVLREEGHVARPAEPEALYLPLKDAAALVSLSTDTLTRAIKRGDLAAAQGGTLIRIARTDLLAWMRARPMRAGTVVDLDAEIRRIRAG